ncbi:MAG: nucleoside phosphorylase [Nitratireductor sp.]
MNRRTVPTALHPFTDGRPPHLPCGPGDVCADVLVPGDPDRVALLATMLDSVTDFGRRREFAVVSGRYKGHPLTICSSGIGGPSTEIALVELAMLGARRVIRIGGMSALVDDIPTGSYVVADKAIGMSGVAPLYSTAAADELSSDPGLCAALLDTARAKGLVVRPGKVATSDSYYLGQDRPFAAAAALETSYLESFRKRGAVGVDMESQVILSVSQRIGLKAACLLGVHGNRATDDWLVDYEPTQRNLLHIAGDALIRAQSETPKEKE